ncbi:MAG: hypothetical protein KAW12_07705 [Candidatus Aminicenantes bacterium]|nr:hypothetical protein [Candidatus Aminicenantes bacterium]
MNREDQQAPKKFNYVFWLIIVLGILTVFTFFNTWAVIKGKAEVRTDNTDYLNAIIGITGFLAAFSVISIYSVFNANVEKEKVKLENLRSKVEEKDTDLESQIKDKTQELSGKLQAQIDLSEETGMELNDYLNLIKSINNLTSPYCIDLKKIEAIKYFSTIPYVDEDIQELIYNFYKSIESNEEEKSKRYYPELKKLLEEWGYD